jgi:predicted CopG family antitoxin
MRTRSIISVLRRSGRLRRTSKRIKYTEALKSLKAYQNSKLVIEDVIDNVRHPKKSISKKCQLEGCGSVIRWEYLLRSKETNDTIVAGSTCVWVMLGLSEEEIKVFQKMEYSIKAFHDMLAWKSENEDVYDKLMKLKENNVWFYRPFWEEVDYCRLHPEDTDYIRNIDVDYEIQKHLKKLEKRSSVSKVIDKVKQASQIENKDPNYNLIVNKLKLLANKYLSDTLLQSMVLQVNTGRDLTDNQIHKVKALINLEYFYNTIKGTPKETAYNECDSFIITLFRDLVESRDIKIYYMDIQKVNTANGVRAMIVKYKRQFHDYLVEHDTDKAMLEYWKYYRIKHEIIMK